MQSIIALPMSVYFDFNNYVRMAYKDMYILQDFENTSS